MRTTLNLHNGTINTGAQMHLPDYDTAALLQVLQQAYTQDTHTHVAVLCNNRNAFIVASCNAVQGCRGPILPEIGTFYATFPYGPNDDGTQYAAAVDFAVALITGNAEI